RAGSRRGALGDRRPPGSRGPARPQANDVAVDVETVRAAVAARCREVRIPWARQPSAARGTARRELGRRLRRRRSPGPRVRRGSAGEGHLPIAATHDQAGFHDAQTLRVNCTTQLTRDPAMTTGPTCGTEVLAGRSVDERPAGRAARRTTRSAPHTRRVAYGFPVGRGAMNSETALARAREIASNVIAPQAAANDREGRFSLDAVR